MKKVIVSLIMFLTLLSCKQVTDLDIYHNIGDSRLSYPSWFDPGTYVSAINGISYLDFHENYFTYYLKNAIGTVPVLDQMVYPARKVKVDTEGLENEFYLEICTDTATLKFKIKKIEQNLEIEKYFIQNDVISHENWGLYKKKS